MPNYPIHTIASAPENSKSALQQLQQAFGVTPNIAAAIANAMPVLPEVGSMSVSPGLIVPRFSASTTIERAGRSFTEPAGLLPSSFASRTLLLCPASRCSWTSGVLPTVSSMVLYTMEC